MAAPTALSTAVVLDASLDRFLGPVGGLAPKPAGPVRVATGTSDNLVPHAQARRLAVDWCDKGADVTYKAVALPDVGSALLNHFGPLLTDQGDAVSWLKDRLSGKPAASTCGSLPAQP